MSNDYYSSLLLPLNINYSAVCSVKITEFSKSCNQNVQTYCSLIFNAMSVILQEIFFFRSPFEDSNKITQKKDWFIFHFCSSQSVLDTFEQLLLLVHITFGISYSIDPHILLKYWDLRLESFTFPEYEDF